MHPINVFIHWIIIIAALPRLLVEIIIVYNNHHYKSIILLLLADEEIVESCWCQLNVCDMIESNTRIAYPRCSIEKGYYYAAHV
jgi:hypothetical protein